MTVEAKSEPEKATFAAGCFWGVEAAFRRLTGVKEAVAGYTGGTKEQPSYEDVCGGNTGHAEAVQIAFDPKEISYDLLLEFFWKIHDPTQVNRQGADLGAQYRSAIFYHTTDQKQRAEKSREALARSGAYKKPIATEIVPAAVFWPAEDYHQRYLEKRGLAACRASA